MTSKPGSQAIAIYILTIITNTKKYLQSHWVRGVQYWPYLYSVFHTLTLLLNKKTFVFRSRMYSLKNKLIVNHLSKIIYLYV